ncbi:MAG: hypothetical protein Q9203_000291 [Teloschistes exilis]
MSGTPRLRSAYPSTPNSGQRLPNSYGGGKGVSEPRVPLQVLSGPPQDPQAPLVPFSLVDAPSQRLYITFFYLGLTVWRLWDHQRLVSDDSDSLWLFMKWVAIDSVFLYGLPGLKVPWLQWSATTMTILFAVHAIADAVLMFRIPIPVEAWLVAFTRLFYDRELAVSERRVKPATILQNSSLILGKQIIHILPEGSAMLNPEQAPYCIDTVTTSVDLPIRVNQTNPISIELLRIDLDTNLNETITINPKEIRKLKKQAEKRFLHHEPASPRLLQYTVKQTGLYRLQKVVDESKLEVQRRLSDALVVRCPSASIKTVPENKCMGDLSNFHLRVDATAPIIVKYSKIVKGEERGRVVLSIPPENLASPLVRQRTSGALITGNPAANVDVSWARTQSTDIPLNESLGVIGDWEYSIDEVEDGCGNRVTYNNSHLVEFYRQRQISTLPLRQKFSVHERPKAYLQGCDSQRPLRVPKGKSIRLPVEIGQIRPNELDHGAHSFKFSYQFTPSADILPNQEHAKNASFADFQLGNNAASHEISAPGLYTLRSVQSAFCAGEVLEPSSCLLSNPTEPSLNIDSQTIPDRCAGNSVGLTVDLDLTGTPPFRIAYIIRRRGGHVTPEVKETDLLHTQLEFRPAHSGHYTYEFLEISDSVYKEPRSLRDQIFVLEQDVKPPASARFLDPYPNRKTCIGEPVSLGIQLMGDAPWNLDYEIVHQGRRHKRKLDAIDTSIFTLTTDELSNGGEYSVALTAVTDRAGCKVSLEQETKIEVALQRPKASFGVIDGHRTILALAGRPVKLPLRLQGEAPWTVTHRKQNSDDLITSQFRNSNPDIEVREAGVYELVTVNDATCPGNLDAALNTFKVDWIPRPQVRMSESALVELVDDKFIKRDICEGDEDAVELSFTGTPPFDVEYDHEREPERGQRSTNTKKFTAGIRLASVRMDSSIAGLHRYKISKLSDLSYSHDRLSFVPVVVEQRVQARPAAAFFEGGMTYKYCKEEEAGGENVPISLQGKPPFLLEVEIRHHSSAKPEVVTIPNIETNRYNLHIPHRLLALGTHVLRIRKIKDANGCHRRMGQEAPAVHVNVAEVPSISALEALTDYCVGDRIAYTLSGSPPFNVFYTFQGQERKASSKTTDFRRLAEKPGEFTITAVTDQRSAECKAHVQITKTIHEMPSVRVSKGRTASVDIHEGGEAKILFEFGGTPPFEFSYTRSSNPPKGKKPQILETKSDVSYEHTKTVLASDEGIYEVVAIKDRFCAFSTQKVSGTSGQKLLTYR